MSGMPMPMTLINLEDELDNAIPSTQPFTKLSELTVPAPVLMPVSSFHVAMKVPAVAVDSTDVLAPADDHPTSEEAEGALMFGRYLGQVVARVNRAWVRPRSAIGSSEFTCLVEVLQERDRTVKEITLKRCNGTTEWQLSVVRAIESASPFPAPPDAAVFSPALTFEMTSEAFARGGSADGYEPSSRDALSMPGAASRQSLDETISRLRSGKGGLVDLRIQGTPVPPPADADRATPPFDPPSP